MAFENRQYAIEQLLNTFKVLGCSFSRDEESILFSSSKSGIFNACTISIEGGKERQLTHSKTSQTYGLSLFPSDSRILVSHDREGDENYHHYVLQADGSELDITPGEAVRANYYRESSDHEFFYSSTNQRDPHLFDIYKTHFSTLARELIFQDMMGYQLSNISRDETHIAFIKPNTRQDSDIYLYNLEAQEMRHITPHSGHALFRSAVFDVQTRFLYYLTDEGHEFQYIRRYELATGRFEIFELSPWDISYISFSESGRYRVVASNENAQTLIRIHEHETNRPIGLPKIPDGDLVGLRISPSDRLMGFYVNGDCSPDTFYVCDIGSGDIRKLTGGLAAGIDPLDLVESKRVNYKSFDGLDIPSLLWEPRRSKLETRIPALVYVHGGPGGQIRKKYNELIQYLVNHGYLVLGVNYRGSSGYGKTFKAADNRRHGREPLWDCVAAKNYLASLGYVDMSRIGIIGGSYGGYMVLAALAFQPDEFAVGVDMFGSSNLARTIESFAPYWKPSLKGLYEKIGDPECDREALRAVSPLFHAQNIVKPLLVLHSENDPRVLKVESDEIVNAIRKQNGIVEYIVFAKEGHGLARRENKMYAYKRILHFLDCHLKEQLK